MAGQNAFDWYEGEETSGIVAEEHDDADAQDQKEESGEEGKTVPKEKKSPIDQIKDLAQKHMDEKTSTPDKPKDKAEKIDDGKKDSAAADPGKKDSATDGTKDKAKAEEVKAEIPLELIIKAGQLGLPADQIRKMSPEALQAVVSFMETGWKGKKEEDGSKQEAENSKQEQKLKKLTLELDGFDEDVVKTLNGINDHYHGTIETLMSQVEQLSSQLQGLSKDRDSERSEQFYRWFDDQVVAIQEDYSEVFGKGQMDNLDEKSKEAENRLTLAREMMHLKKAHPEMDKQKLFKMALKVAFSEHEEKLLSQRAKKKATEHKERVTARPTHKTMGEQVMEHGFRVPSGDGETDKKKSALATIKSKFGSLFSA